MATATATASVSQPHRPLGFELRTTSTSKVYSLDKIYGIRFVCKGFVDITSQKFFPGVSKKNCCLRYSLLENGKVIHSSKWLEGKRQRAPFQRARRMIGEIPMSSSDDGVSVNGISPDCSSSALEQMRVKLDQTLRNEDLGSGLVQSIHDAARAIELAFLEHSSLSRSSWFTKTWLGVDKNAWLKSLSYQAAVDSLLQATIEISSRGNARDRDMNVFVQRSLARLHGPLESVIQDQLSQKQPTSYEWFLSEQNPITVSTFVNILEKDPPFSSATAICSNGELATSTENDLSLLMLALSCLAAITKLGSTKVSCQQFFTMIPDVIGRLMDMLVEFVPISKVYKSMKDIGLSREFLFHFGPRAAVTKSPNDNGVEEIRFWVDLFQNQLQRAIDREKIWSRLTTSESIEVLEKDLAIFGFFIALGRSTQTYLSSNGLTAVEDSINDIIRYLIGGSVLYYPQLSSISSYQLYVEVVCEELEWIPFYLSDLSKLTPDSKGEERLPKEEVISRVLNVCSHWMSSFIKYSMWLENPSNIKAARFLARGHVMLSDRMKDLGLTNNRKKSDMRDQGSLAGSDIGSFDKALESVEEALVRLENLLQELHVSSSNSGKEELKAACSDLERIRKLKKEAEFLEASFRAKAALLEQDNADVGPISSVSEEGSRTKPGEDEETSSSQPLDRLERKPRGFWSSLIRGSVRKTEPGTADQETAIAKVDNQDTESNDILRFEKLRQELIELENRVQRSTDDSQNKEVTQEADNLDDKDDDSGLHLMLVPAGAVPKNENLIAKSMDKIKETTTDVLQGTQLLAIDTAAAMHLLKRSITGDELTEKEKKALQRTVTDLASVVPIGILMLLPVTAVGHAAILAFIQRYVPSMIPSTYAPERLDLLRQLEKVKEMEIAEANTDDVPQAVSLSSGEMK